MRESSLPPIRYKARDASGRVVRALFNEGTEADLEAYLQQRGQILIEAAQARPTTRKGTPRGPRRTGRLKRQEVLAFTQHLVSVIATGLPMLEGLQDIVKATTRPLSRQILEDVLREVEGGSSLSKALARHPKAFSGFYVSLVEAGEATGQLETVLHDVVAFMEWQQETRNSVREATTYPMVVVTILTGVLSAIFTFVVPRFSEILKKLNVPLPFLTATIIDIGEAAKTYWLYFLGGIVIFFILFRMVKATAPGRLALARLTLSLPIVGELNRKVAVSRFTHYFSLLYKAGIDLVRIFELLQKVVANAVFAQEVARILELVKGGWSISRSLATSKEFPNIVVRTLAVGETTGSLHEGLDRLSRHYDQEIPLAVKQVISIIQPLLFVALGAGVLLVALSLYLPIWRLISSITAGVR